MKVLAVIAGVVAMFVIAIAVQMLIPILHSVPAGLDPRDATALSAWMAGAPISVKLLTVAAWLLGALGGGWLALRLSGWVNGAWIVAGLDALMAVSNIARIDYPLWVKVAAVAAPLLGGWLAIRLGSARVRADESING